MTSIALRVAALGAFIVAPLQAQTAPSWFKWHNEVVPTVTASVSLEPTGDFRYRYTVANGASARQKVNFFFLELAIRGSGATSPTDWYHILGDNSVSWGSAGTVDPAWRAEHEADIASFLSEIAPGTSLTGFDLLSPCAGSGTPLTWYAQGYNHLGVQPDDDTTSAPEPTWRMDAVKGMVLGPSDCATVADWGNRRPGVDGFLGVVNFTNGATLPAGPVRVQVRFSRGGETVERSTFSAVLNGVDVTSQFRANSRGDVVAVFAPGSSAAQSGRNVLLLKVDGHILGTTRTATDADRFSFTLP